MKLKQILHLAAVGLMGTQISLIGAQASFGQAPTVTSPSAKPTSDKKTPLVRPPRTPKPQIAPGSRPNSSATRSKVNRFSFACNNDNMVVLEVERPKADSSTMTKPIPFIQFTVKGSKNFSGEYTPRNRCNEVTSRFNKFLINNSQLVAKAKLNTGIMNGQTVICISTDTGCKNLLLTLKPENRSKAKSILGGIQAAIMNPTSAGKVIALESEDEENTLESESVDLEEAVNTGITQLESEDQEFAEAGLESEQGDRELPSQVENNQTPDENPSENQGNESDSF